MSQKKSLANAFDEQEGKEGGEKSDKTPKGSSPSKKNSHLKNLSSIVVMGVGEIDVRFKRNGEKLYYDRDTDTVVHERPDDIKGNLKTYYNRDYIIGCTTFNE
jgi:Cu/Zn superoxide dismutase